MYTHGTCRLCVGAYPRSPSKTTIYCKHQRGNGDEGVAAKRLRVQEESTNRADQAGRVNSQADQANNVTSRVDQVKCVTINAAEPNCSSRGAPLPSTLRTTPPTCHRPCHRRATVCRAVSTVVMSIAVKARSRKLIDACANRFRKYPYESQIFAK